MPWIGRLRAAVFPGSVRWKREDGLYYALRGILREAREDPKVQSDI